jgi:hypothetical protein
MSVWFDFKKQKPNIFEYCIVFDSYLKDTFIAQLGSNGNFYVKGNEVFMLFNVSHWTSLPLPPDINSN